MKIDTVLFDMGGTLEEIWYVPEIASILPKRLEQILQIPYGDITNEDGATCYSRMQKNYAMYRKFREKSCVEGHPAMVWRDWVLKDYAVEDQIIFNHHEELAYFWETEVITRKCREGLHEMLQGLKDRGIRMGVISNTGSFTQVRESLKNYRIQSFFEVIVLSVDYGIRKPHPFLFHDALKRMHSKSSQAMYVGDTLSRDVAGAISAGLSKTIQIKSEFTKLSDVEVNNELVPDFIINSLMEIPPIIDEINKV